MKSKEKSSKKGKKRKERPKITNDITWKETESMNTTDHEHDKSNTINNEVHIVPDESSAKDLNHDKKKKDKENEEEQKRLKKKRKKELKKEKKKSKKELKKEKKEKRGNKETSDTIIETSIPSNEEEDGDDKKEDSISSKSSSLLRGIVASSAKYTHVTNTDNNEMVRMDKTGVTLLLFYQYVEPPWTNAEYQKALTYANESASTFQLTGRMRIAKEGFNCTLTGTYDNIRSWCIQLRSFAKPSFEHTEFKLTDHLPEKQRFPKLNCFHVQELVHYGLTGDQAPPIGKTGIHLEPHLYHDKMKENDAVIIDVRNHYEATIGHFTPPSNGAQLIDPMMRKSTEFPIWLDKPETKQLLKNKQVLMYCTGGVRCERASALLRQKMETEKDVQDLNIKGVYQLQGGIDKYFKSFPDGGFWEGKNYTFDKRFAHAPPNANANANANAVVPSSLLPSPHNKDGDASSSSSSSSSSQTTNGFDKILGKCEACSKPWDMYRGKRRCPTCGVPSLICKDCFQNDIQNIKKLDKTIRCKLCVEQNITSKLQIKQHEIWEMEQYALKQRAELMTNNKSNQGNTQGNTANKNKSKTNAVSNPDNTTRLFVKNMCIKTMDEVTLCLTLPGITHIQWLSDRKTGNFYGSAFVEMDTSIHAAEAVSKNGIMVLSRPIKIMFHKADGKDLWPPPDCAVSCYTSNNDLEE